MSTQITSVSAKVTVGGTQTTYDGFIYNAESGYWEKEITAPSQSSYLSLGGYFPVEVTANDEAGNSKTATVSDFDALKLRVKENDAPTITLLDIAPGTNTSNSKPTVRILVSDTNSGVNASECYAVIDSGPQNEVTLTKNGDNAASGSFTPSDALSDGTHTITVFAKDNDGNPGSSSVTFVVMAAQPNLTVNAPNEEITITNSRTITVSGTTNTNTGNTITITLDGVDQGNVVIQGNSFTKTFIASSDGEHTIIVKATNAAGVETVVTRTVIIDTVVPEFKEVIIAPNPVELGKATKYIIKVKVE